MRNTNLDGFCVRSMVYEQNRHGFPTRLPLVCNILYDKTAGVRCSEDE